MFESEQATINQAAASVRAAQAQVRTEDAKATYAPQELQRREDGLIAWFDQQTAPVETTLDEAEAEARQQLSLLEHDAPLKRLSVEQLTLASAQSVFWKEDFESQRTDALIPRCEQALASGDLVEMFLAERYAAARFERERAGGRQVTNEASRLGFLAGQLREKLADPAIPAKRQQAEETLEAAIQTRMRRREVRGELSGETERYRAANTATYARSF